jgi:hypothetical protein
VKQDPSPGAKAIELDDEIINRLQGTDSVEANSDVWYSPMKIADMFKVPLSTVCNNAKKEDTFTSRRRIAKHGKKKGIEIELKSFEQWHKSYYLPFKA